PWYSPVPFVSVLASNAFVGGALAATAFWCGVCRIAAEAAPTGLVWRFGAVRRVGCGNGSGFGLTGGAEVALACLAPAQFDNAGFGGRVLGGLAEAGVDGEFEVELGAAAVAVDLPGVDGQVAEGRAAGGGHPLAGRVDQVADLVDGQAHVQLAAALEGDQQGVTALDRAAVAGDLVAARRQGAAFGEGVGGVEQVVAEVVFGHGGDLGRGGNGSKSRGAEALCWTGVEIEGGVRVISFRKANKREVRQYESQA